MYIYRYTICLIHINLVPGIVQKLALHHVNTTAINITWNPPDSTAYLQSYEVLLQHRNGTQIDKVILHVILNHYLAKRLGEF